MLKRIGRLASVAASLVAMGGCSDPPSDRSRESRTEDPPCEVHGLAMVAGGLNAPEHVFGDVPDVSLLPDSGVVAVDRQAAQLHVFDADGRFLRALGGTGEGPGEFLDPIAVDVVDGRIFAWDWDQLRITEFELGSEEVVTYPVPGQLNPREHFGRFSNGFVIGAATGNLIPDPGSTSWTRDLGIITFYPSSGAVDTIQNVPDQVTTWVNQSQREAGSPFFAPRADVVVSSGRLYWARGDSALLVRFDGSRTDTLRWDWPLRQVSENDLEVFRANVLARRPKASHPALNRLFEVLPVQDEFPVIEKLVPDLDGGIWVHLYPTPRDTTQTYLRLDGDTVVCRVQLPRGFTATEGGRSWLLGVATDQMDVPRVERWRIGPNTH